MLQYESKMGIRCLLALLRGLGASKNLKSAYTKVRVDVSKSLGGVQRTLYDAEVSAVLASSIGEGV